jgi:deoxycytidylate deaminase
MGERPSYDEYFMEMAHIVSKRSTCKRRKVGAILVKDKHILSTGYNGAPKGLKHCTDVGCLREDLKFLQVKDMNYAEVFMLNKMQLFKLLYLAFP